MDTNQPFKKIPSNIIIKSVYNQYEYKANMHNYMNDTIYEIYNFIFLNKDIDLNELEIEAKLGKFLFKGNSVLGYEYIKETFKIPAWDPRESAFKYDFLSGLDEERFFLIWHFVEKESDNPQSNIKKLQPKNYRETHYKSGKRKSQIIENNQIMHEEVIKKEKKMHFNIRNNGMDFRMTSCLENKSEINENDEISMNRDKFRISYEYQFFRIDFTIVNSFKINSDPELNYEVELELLSEGIKNQFDYFKEYRNFEYLFKRFFENVFCLYELTQKEYFSDKLLQKGNKFFGNVFGNYLEKNFDKNNL